MRYSAQISVPYSKALWSALLPEIMEQERMRLCLKKDGRTLVIVAEATDATAFRAVINTVLRYLAVAEAVDKIRGERYGTTT